VKTESMILERGEISQTLSKEAYYPFIVGEDKKWVEKSRGCNWCGNIESQSNLTKHQHTNKVIDDKKNFSGLSLR
jgi:hypothetical protein